MIWRSGTEKTFAMYENGCGEGRATSPLRSPRRCAPLEGVESGHSRRRQLNAQEVEIAKAAGRLGSRIADREIDPGIVRHGGGEHRRRAGKRRHDGGGMVPVRIVEELGRRRSRGCSESQWPPLAPPFASPSKTPTVKVVVPLGTESSRSSVGWLRVMKLDPLAIARTGHPFASQLGRQLNVARAWTDTAARNRKAISAPNFHRKDSIKEPPLISQALTRGECRGSQTMNRKSKGSFTAGRQAPSAAGPWILLCGGSSASSSSTGRLTSLAQLARIAQIAPAGLQVAHHVAENRFVGRRCSRGSSNGPARTSSDSVFALPSLTGRPPLGLVKVLGMTQLKAASAALSVRSVRSPSIDGIQ